MSEPKTVLVVGVGRFGLSLCRRLTELGHRVVAVDRNREAVEAVADTAELAAQLDVTDEETLEKAGAREVDIAVVAIGENIEAAIMATAILKEFNVPRIVARADTALTARILARVGANRIVLPAKEMGEIVAEKVVYPHLFRFSHLPGEDFFVGKISPHPDMLGKTLRQLDLDKDCDIAATLIRRGGNRMIPGPDAPLEAGDHLMIFGRADEIEDLISRIERGQHSEPFGKRES